MSPSQTSSRSHSFASTSSESSTDPTTTTLADTARTILTSLYNNTNNMIDHSLNQHISPHLSIQHNDDSPMLSTRETYLSTFRTKRQSFPNYRLDVQETCVDETQMKVWVRSQITGLPGGVRKQSISMLSFNEEGLLVGSVDYQRKIRDGDDD